MASINDHKLVNIKSKNMFKHIPNIKDLSKLDDAAKARLGFYHLIIENLTGISDASDVQEIIQDTEYLKLTNNLVADDLGIDAVFVNKGTEPEKEIMLFNFKFRKKFNPAKTTDGNDLPISAKFLQYLPPTIDLPTDIDKESTVYKNIELVRNCLDSDDIYNITLYFVTNEAHGFSPSYDETIRNFEINYCMKIVTISLDDIISFIDIDKKFVSSKLFINSNDFLSYSSDEKSTDKSYICKVSLLDLVRITCDNDELRDSYNIEEDERIINCKLQYSLLYDNVRGYLGQTNYNKNISKTLDKQHINFFMFNNGLTLTCNEITSEPKNGNTKYLFTLNDFQIVNGGQTLRSIYNYLSNTQNSERLRNLRESNVLIRLFKISSSSTLKNNIAEYTNSQNAISPIDLKSVDSIQIDLEKYLKEEKVLYIRKAGAVEDRDEQFEHRISMEKFTQILYSHQGYPEKVSNLKKKLFVDWYDDIYNENNFQLDDAKPLIELYFEIEKFYSTKSKSSKYDQKIFYIVYLKSKLVDSSIDDLDKLLSTALNEFESDSSEARNLIKNDFKIFLDKFIEEDTKQLNIRF